VKILAIRWQISVIKAYFHGRCAKLPHFYIRSEIRLHHCVPRPCCPIIRDTFCNSSINKGHNAYFSLRTHETAMSILPVWNLTSSSRSSTPISYTTWERRRFANKWGRYRRKWSKMEVFRGNIGEGMVWYWPQWTRSYFCGYYLNTNFGENRSRNATAKVRTDGQMQTGYIICPMLLHSCEAHKN